jgi:hypothetical protein
METSGCGLHLKMQSVRLTDHISRQTLAGTGRRISSVRLSLSDASWWSILNRRIVRSAKRLIIQILQSLAANGWMFCSACDLTKQARDKDTLFFRMSPPVQVLYTRMILEHNVAFSS